MSAAREVLITTDAVELAALLKWAQVVGSGGEAKQLIQGGLVRVNGEVERRRGRKLRPGDRVEVGGAAIVVTSVEARSPRPGN